ncbi:FAD-dependent monooxygenase [Paenibacillus sp. TRM 82003]|uniref:FAD-dependent oxidoreductase n=1 Tax=Kineococcus sp. TRM81007 TaxID=2925831 RepID=UPI001F55BBA5|nr:FAD-dependent oxidoreductase [Kineococcus sp. TRM81007]MCI2237007.1 FAD-dependent monooxygenase [Kineococcus sp. TRM81007]MCI3926598.1 FAD-dependent monooxygenase [Paenibacillus sp. TRM 82003]
MRAVVCGAGVAGLTLAGQLARAGADVVLLERAPGPRTGGYVLDFFGPGYDAAEAMGVLPRLLAAGYSFEEVDLVDASGRRRAGLRFDRFAAAAGGRLVSLARPDLERVLREHLPAGVDVRFGTTVTAVEDHPGGVAVTLSDGERVDADLLAGCDGVRSTVRALAFGPAERYVRPLPFRVATFTVEDPVLREAVGARVCLTDTAQRTVGLYGLRDGRVAVLALHRTRATAPPADARAALRREHASLGWVVPRALAACPPPERIHHDEVAQVVAPAWTRGRVVLVGDAAHAVSLLAGQGASLAVAGAYLLAEQLRRRPSVEDALAAYEAALRPLVRDRQEAAHRSARWFVPATRRDVLLRRAALALVRLPLADRLVATSLTGGSSSLVADLRAGRPVP